MLSIFAVFMLFLVLFVLMCRTKLFKESAVGIWLRWKVLNPMAQILVIVFFGYLVVFAAVKPPVEPPAIPPLGLELTPVLVESQISGSTATASKTKSKDTPSILADNGYKRLSENGGSFISRTVTNTALPWLVMPSNAVVYSGWTNYGIAEDTFWVCKTNPAASWDFIYADTLVDGAHVSSSGTLSFGDPKGSPTPHEMPDGTGIDFLAPFHSTLSMIPPNGRVWHHTTDSNSVRFTWQNFLVGRDTNNAISFQAELFMNGDYTFRYAFPLHFLSFTNNFVIGAQFGGVGETFAMNNYSNLADGLDIIWDLPDSQVDTDGDGTYDIVELYYGFDPKAYTPEDWDNDGLSNNFEYYYTNSVSTNGLERLNARLFDSDGDKLPDLFEVTYTNFNPLVAHSTTSETLTGNPDNDGLNNAEEMVYGTNPFLPNGIPSVDTNIYPDIVNCTLELSTTDDDNDYMLLVMGESTNILLTADGGQSDNYILPLCSTNQPLNVKLSRNLEVQSNDSPVLSDVTARVYSMDPWIITCYGDVYPGYRPPLPYSLNSGITRNSGGEESGGAVTFHIPTMTVDIVSSYSSSYYYYIMCGCNNLSDALNVTALVRIEREDGLIGIPYIFNATPITCTASGTGTLFQQDSDEDTINFGSTIIDFYSVYEYADFTLDMGVDNLENFDSDGNYNYNISVEATEEKLGTCSDNVDVPVDIKLSHGSWSIESMLNPSNVINILNSTNASVGIDFHHSECADYFLYGTLYITPDGNMDIFTLDDISREIDIYGDYSTSESFEVIGCSENVNDIIVDIWFYGYEYEYFFESHSLTTCGLIASNINNTAEMYDGLGDADNDGTNNVNDLNNAGEFIEILIKTHESATNAFFRLEFDEDDIAIWTEDSNAMITRTNSYIPNGNLIQAHHNYSYNDLFSDEAERTFYVQGLEAGEHDIDVVYVLDNTDLWTNDLSVTFVKTDMTAYRPQTEYAGYGEPFQRHEIPDDLEEDPGAGIRVNGDTETGASENDLIEVELKIESYPVPSGLTYVLKRNNTNIKVWDSRSMGNAILDSETEATVTFSSYTKTVWVENPAGGTADLEFIARVGSVDVDSDKIHFYPFTSIVVLFEGEGGNPADPPVPGLKGMGISVIALNLYTNGYDVHNYVDSPTVDAYNEILNAVSNRCVEQIALIGYSHGGGTVYDISEELSNSSLNYTLRCTAYIDAIKQPFTSFFSEDRRPENSLFHVNYFQGGIIPHGVLTSPSNSCYQVNLDSNGNNESHLTIDDNLGVQVGIINKLKLWMEK